VFACTGAFCVRDPGSSSTLAVVPRLSAPLSSLYLTISGG
jgi:hypothetical protein